MDLPVLAVLQVVRDSAGKWDTRRIDLTLGLRGVPVDHGILGDMYELSERGLIEEVIDGRRGTGPKWRITPAGEAFLAEHEGKDDPVPPTTPGTPN